MKIELKQIVGRGTMGTGYARHRIGCIMALVGVALAWGTARAQIVEYNHPELDWYTIETNHFFVHFHKGTERTAQLVAKIAEEVWPVITTLYLYEPDKIHFVIRDHDDVSNGAAFYFNNKIEIWAPSMDFEFRGTHNWLRNVVTHEFTHMVSLQASMRFSRRVPAMYFQAIGYEEEKRPDVIRGYPNTIVSYPLAGTVIPVWFAEGVAQFQVPGLGYDTWDSHRDMLLRTAVLEGELLPFEEMGVFGKNSLGNERAYNQGYALVSYIASRYGTESVRRITKAMSNPLRFSLSSAIRKVIGKDGSALYREWREFLKEKYSYQVSEIRKQVVEGEIVDSDGLAMLYPRWSPDGKRLAYLASRGDYLSQTSLVVLDPLTGKREKLRGGVTTSFSWSPDGREIVYARRNKVNRYGSHYRDLFVYDLSSRSERRLTLALRAYAPDWSPDGKSIVFVFQRDGTSNLGLLRLEDNKLEILTSFESGEQCYTPRWSPDGRRIVFARSTSRGRSLYLLDVTSRKVRPLLVDDHDARDPVFSADGRWIYFSYDRTGIFNIYSLDLKTKRKVRPLLTNVLGGAFMPSVAPDGRLAYASFGARGYRLAVLDKPKPLSPEKARYLRYQPTFQVASTADGAIPLDISSIQYQKVDDSKVPDYPVLKYANQYSAVAFLPRVMVDYGTLKFGTYLFSSDVLDKYSFIGGFALNRRKDYDLFGIVEYRNLLPTLFLEAYNQVQHIKEGDVDWRFNLIEVDGGARLKLNDRQDLELRAVYSRYNARLRTIERNQLVNFGYTYFVGRELGLRWSYNGVARTVDREAHPRAGRTLWLRYTRASDKLLRGFQISSQFGTLLEDFEVFPYNKFELLWREHIGLWGKHVLTLQLRGGAIDRSVDSFLNFFAGGLDGIRGYPYYSIEGRKLLHGRLTYRLPVTEKLDFRLLQLYFDKLYFATYYDYGDAFDQDRIDFNSFKKSVGLQLRLETYSFYVYPTRIYFDAAYGFNRVVNRDQVYGKEWRFYFGVAFGYLD
jgi:WD40 repeat protein